MNDNDVLAILIDALRVGLTANGFADPEIAPSYQVSRQGRNTTPTWYIHRITAHRYGFQSNKQAFNDTNQNFDVTESWLLERTYQITTLSKELASDTTRPTAFDMADIAAAVVQSRAFTDELRDNNIDIYRVTDIRTPYFSDASNENELSPNFDFTVQYCRSIQSTVEPATIRGNVHEV